MITGRGKNRAKPAGLSRPNPNATGIDVGATSHIAAIPMHHVQHMQKALTQVNPAPGLFLLVHRYIPDGVNAVAVGLAGDRIAEHQHCRRFDYAPAADQRTRRSRKPCKEITGSDHSMLPAKPQHQTVKVADFDYTFARNVPGLTEPLAGEGVPVHAGPAAAPAQMEANRAWGSPAAVSTSRLRALVKAT